MTQSERNPEDWGAIFSAERATYLAFTSALESLVRQLLEQANIPFAQVEGRTKDVANFESKLKRKKGEYPNPLEEVTDLTGLRIVLFYFDDIERVSTLIDQEFVVDSENSVDKSVALDPDRFGYLSVHQIVSLRSSRKALLEWSRFGGLCAEIQVRTVLQHAWAAISRKLAYASVREAPRDLQRNLNRLSALLELADSEFVDIRQAREAIETEYDREVERGNLDLQLDESSLEIYLREAGIQDRISCLAREAGSATASVDEDQVEPGWSRRLLQELLKVLEERAGWERIEDLDEMLNENWSALPKFMEYVNTHYRDEDDHPIDDHPYNWLALIVLWSLRAPKDAFKECRYVDQLADVVMATYKEEAI